MTKTTGLNRAVARGYLDAASSEPLHPAAREVLLSALDSGFADPLRDELLAAGARVYGHDPYFDAEHLRRLGFEPYDLDHPEPIRVAVLQEALHPGGRIPADRAPLVDRAPLGDRGRWCSCARRKGIARYSWCDEAIWAGHIGWSCPFAGPDSRAHQNCPVWA